MSGKSIQLPPLPVETSHIELNLIWEIAKLSKDNQEEFIKELGNIINLKHDGEPISIPDEHIPEVMETVRETVRTLTYEISEVACWVYKKKYEQGKSLADMLEELPLAAPFITVLDTVFETYETDKDITNNSKFMS